MNRNILIDKIAHVVTSSQAPLDVFPREIKKYSNVFSIHTACGPQKGLNLLFVYDIWYTSCNKNALGVRSGGWVLDVEDA